MTTPLISVIVSTCNRTELLPVALKSLKWQLFKDFEVIVVNDGEDRVEATIEPFISTLDVTLVHTQRPSMGPSAARNTGIRASQGQYLIYLDDDDFFYEDHLLLLVQTVYTTDIPVAFTDSTAASQKVIDGSYQTVARRVQLSYDFSRKNLYAFNITPLLNVLHQKKLLEEVGEFAEYMQGHEDWDLWQRMSRFSDFSHSALATSEYITREGKVSLTTRLQTMHDTWMFCRRQGLLFETLPPVCELIENGKVANTSKPKECAPCKVSVVLPIGDAEVFMQSKDALDALWVLCETAGAAQIVLVGAGVGVKILHKQVAKRVTTEPLYVQNIADTGRVLACNQGASIARGEFLLFLEPYVEPSGTWLETFIETMEADNAIGAVSGVITSPAGNIYGGRRNSHDEISFDMRKQRAASIAPAAFISSICFMVKKELFIKMGGFDVAYAPGHYADADFCNKLSEQQLKCVVATTVHMAWNKGKKSLTQSPAGLVSRRVFWDRWSERPYEMTSLLEGADWSMRPMEAEPIFPSDGKMPTSFDVVSPYICKTQVQGVPLK